MEDPGTRFRYSEGTTALGRLVEVLSGKTFDAFVTERILKPLGMNDTTFWVEGEAHARLATVYQLAPAGGLAPFEMEAEVPFTERPALIEGAVGLVSTAPDFLRFCQMLLNKGELDGVRLLKRGDGRGDYEERPDAGRAAATRRRHGMGTGQRRRGRHAKSARLPDRGR